MTSTAPGPAPGPGPGPTPGPRPGPRPGPGLRIIRTGLLTTVQDLGRPGHAHLGIPRSGAADQRALRLANRLVGNPEDAAALETTLTGCTVELTEARWVAVCGARAWVTLTLMQHADTPRLSGPHAARPHRHTAEFAAAESDLASLRAPARTRGVGHGVAFYAPAGSVLDIGAAQAGVRSYLAIAGGIATEPVLGSRSADLLSGIGHEQPLANDDLLPVGAVSRDNLPPDIPLLGLAPLRDPTEPAVLRLLPGPRDDWFATDALAYLAVTAYEVSEASNRTALRLIGPSPRRVQTGELASEGLVPGALQIPPTGGPVLFLADHPVTGGYPVVGCVHPDDLPAVAQARPGSVIRFRPQSRP